jgi:iron complex outermembrane recepter protein
MTCKSLFVASTAMLAALACLGGAGAQDDKSVGAVEVTGFRASLENALSQKESANLIVDTELLEGSDKIADGNIAESLERLSGVQIDRVNGEGTQVRIHGMANNIVLMDGDLFVSGREVYQSGERSDSGMGDEYRNSLEAIPAMLLAGFNLYRSPDASTVAGGLGGTINLISRSAFDVADGFSIAALAKASYAQNAVKATPSAAAMATYKLNEKFAVSAAISWDHNTTRTYEMQAKSDSDWYVAGPTADVLNTVGEDYIQPETMYLINRSFERRRFGLSLGMEFSPVDSVKASLKWFHTDMRSDTRDVSDKIGFSESSGNLGLVSTDAYSIDSNGVVRSGTFSSNALNLSTMVDEDKDLADNIQFGAKFDNGGKLRVSAKVAYGRGEARSELAKQDVSLSPYVVSSGSTNNFNDTIVNNYPNYDGCGGNGSVLNDACVFTYSNKHGIYPVIHYTNPSSLVDYDDGMFTAAKAWAFGDTDTRTSFRADAEYDVLDKITVSGGVRYAAREFDYWSGRYLLWNTNLSSTGIYDNWSYLQDPSLAGNPIIMFNNAATRLTTVKNFFPQAGIDKVLVQDPAQMAKCPSCWLNTYENLNGYDMQFFQDPAGTFRVDNKNWSGYFMVDADAPEIGTHINLGLRVVHTQLTIVQDAASTTAYYGSFAGNGVAAVGSRTVTKRDYTDVLPSINIVYDLDDSQKFRLAAARVMAEQNYWDLGEGAQYSYERERNDRTNVSTGAKDGYAFYRGSVGNPNLDPYRATQVDLAYEYNFDPRTMFSVGLFWKGVDSFVTTKDVSTTVDDDFGGTTGVVTKKVNGGDGHLEGAEINARYMLDYGLGMNLNYTYTESKTHSTNSFYDHLPFIGVAKNALTVQPFYQSGPFEGLVSYTWKSGSYAGTYAVDTAKSQWGAYNRAYGQLDVKLAYKVLDIASVVFSGSNLTGEAQSQYLQYKAQPLSYDQSGRRFSLALACEY